MLAFVIDFGSCLENDTIEMSRMGAERAIGIEIREHLVELSRNKTNLYNCHFFTKLPSDLRQQADLVTSELKSGLNRMTIKTFLKYVKDSPFELVSVIYTPIRGFSLFQKLLGREYFTSSIQATLVKRA